MKLQPRLLLLFFLFSCNKEKYFSGPNNYSDDFEKYSKVEQMLEPQDVHWSFTQITKKENSISIDSTSFPLRSKVLKFSALKSSSDKLSKCSIAKQHMAFWEGETMRVKVWYYLAGDKKMNWLFLLDLEEQTAVGAGPGIRLALVENQLRIEHKFNEKDILQTEGKEIDFPRDQWVEIIWEVKLSQKHKGSVKVWQKGTLIINSDSERTLPKDFLYAQQGTKGMYSSVEIGATANSYDNDILLYADDIEFKKIK